VSKERGVQFIVETHSEHLFRRMQTLIAKQQVKSSDCAMYFVERSGNSATLKALTANEYGAITNWPDKFFGDSIGEAREQARARVERQVESADGSLSTSTEVSIGATSLQNKTMGSRLSFRNVRRGKHLALR
jgi:hypothetical protein